MSRDFFGSLSSGVSQQGDWLAELPREILIKELIEPNFESVTFLAFSLTSRSNLGISDNYKGMMERGSVMRLDRARLRGSLLLSKCIVTGSMNLVKWARTLTKKQDSLWAISNAMLKSNVEILTYLLKEKYPVTESYYDLNGPIHVAAKEGFAEGIRLLLAYGYVDPKAVKSQVLDMARVKDSVSVLEVVRETPLAHLLDDLNEVAHGMETCLAEKKLACFEFFLTEYTKRHKREVSTWVFARALDMGNVEMLKVFLAHAPATYFVTQMAIDRENPELIRLCIGALEATKMELYRLFVHAIHRGFASSLDMLCQHEMCEALRASDLGIHLSWLALYHSTEDASAIVFRNYGFPFGEELEAYNHKMRS